MDPLIFKPLTATEAQALHVELARAHVDRALLARALEGLINHPTEGAWRAAIEILTRVQPRVTTQE